MSKVSLIKRTGWDLCIDYSCKRIILTQPTIKISLLCNMIPDTFIALRSAWCTPVFLSDCWQKSTLLVSICYHKRPKIYVVSHSHKSEDLIIVEALQSQKYFLLTICVHFCFKLWKSAINCKKLIFPWKVWSVSNS